MKRILIIIAMLGMFTVLHGKLKSVNGYYKELQGMSEKQISIMVHSYVSGVKDDLGYTVASMGWNETHFGLITVGDQHIVRNGYRGSYGVYQNLLSSVMTRYKIKRRYAPVIKDLLKTDITFAAQECLAELKYWEHRWRNKDISWSRMVASYRAGNHSINSRAGRYNVAMTKRKVAAIKKYFKNDLRQISSELYVLVHMTHMFA